jgi:hypothetical protein
VNRAVSIFPLVLFLVISPISCGSKEGSLPSSLLVHVTYSPQSLLLPNTPPCYNALEISLALEGRKLSSRSSPLTKETGEITLESLVPAQGYELSAYFGFAPSTPDPSRCEAVTKVRAYAKVKFDLAPRESKRISLNLLQCTEPVVENRPCGETFGGEVSPPVLLLYPSRTGCSPYTFGVRKPENADLKVDGQTLSRSSSPAVYYRASLSQGDNYYSFQTVLNEISSDPVNVTIEYDSRSLCFNPYDPLTNHFDPGPPALLRWNPPENVSAPLYILIQNNLSALKENFREEDLRSLGPDSVPAGVGSSGYTFSPPTPPWHLGIYAYNPAKQLWYREGALSYLPEWWSSPREEVK